jgi:hypothetical protein
MVITLEDFEIRYQNLRKTSKRKLKQCTVAGCKNPRDLTPLSGYSNTCSYHRFLFDFWSCEVIHNEKLWYYMEHQKARRRAFSIWLKKMGKEKLDEIVLNMAQEPINWEC